MEAIKNVALEPVKKQVETITSTSSTSNTQKQNVDNINRNKIEANNFEEIKITTEKKMNRIAEAMDTYVRSIQRELKIQVHEGTGKIMVRVTSQDGSKVIREIPPEELLDLAARIEELAGTLFDEKV